MLSDYRVYIIFILYDNTIKYHIWKDREGFLSEKALVDSISLRGAETEGHQASFNLQWAVIGDTLSQHGGFC